MIGRIDMPSRGYDPLGRFVQRRSAAFLIEELSKLLIGQQAAIDAIAPLVEIYEAGLSPVRRPVGTIMLLGPTGTGKTHTVGSLAQVVHGSDVNVLRIDCGEFQLEHEVAKLIGAPPGYLGHRETQPMISQHKLNAIASDGSTLSIVLFDEVEKAAPSLQRLMLGILDRGILKLGDNSTVSFERSIIFMTSNLGSREMDSELRSRYNLASTPATQPSASALRGIGMAAMGRKFSPEFINRIDEVVAYSPLSRESIERILDIKLAELNQLMAARLGPMSFKLALSPEAREYLIDRGTSPTAGARELNRVIYSKVLRRVANLATGGSVEPGSTVSVFVDGDGLRFVPGKAVAASS